jgi:hypothetical protein
MNKNIKLTSAEVNEIQMIIGRLMLSANLDKNAVMGARAEAAIALLSKKLTA